MVIDNNIDYKKEVPIKDKIMLATITTFIISLLFSSIALKFKFYISNFVYKFFIWYIIAFLLLFALSYGIIVGLLSLDYIRNKGYWLLGGIVMIFINFIILTYAVFALEEMLIVVAPIYLAFSFIVGAVVGLLIQKKLSWLVILFIIIYIGFLVFSNYYSYKNQSQETVNEIIKIAKRSEDSSLCENIYNKEKIVYCKALIKKDLNLCNSIKDSVEKNECIYDVISYLKKERGDINLNYCDKISDESVREDCNVRIFGKLDSEFVRKAIPMNCNRSFYLTSHKDACIYDLVIRMYEKDIIYCDNIIDGNLKNNCKTDENKRVWSDFIEKSIPDCKNYETPKRRDSCIISFVKIVSVMEIEGAEKYCDSMETEPKKERCIELISNR